MTRAGPPPDSLFDEVAGAILDGTAVEWAELETDPGATDRALLDQLRVLASVRSVAQASAEPQHVAPRFWGHLRVLEGVGRGAFGQVFRAWDTRLDREVALKLLPLDNDLSDPPSAIIEEGRLLARVRHPNVVTIYGAERIGDQIGLWMEFVRGRTLEQMLGDGVVFTADDILRLGLELCRAVSAVHGAGLLHRDIKAQNVMMADDGRVLLMDFGTGHETRNAFKESIAGTPLYLAPEVLSGGPPTAGSDIYSFGVLLYHLLTGTYPVRAGTLAELHSAHAHGERADLRSLRHDVPPRLTAVIDRATEPDPGLRFASAEALARDLAAASRSNAPTIARYAAGALLALIVIGMGWIWKAGLVRPGEQNSPLEGPEAAPAPHVLQFVQPPVSSRAEPWHPLVTDGSRLYFLERTGSGWQIVRTSAEGEPPTRLDVPFRYTRIYDISRDRAEFLIGRFEDLGQGLPLWIWPAAGGQPIRVGDILVDEALWLPDGTGILYVRGRDVWRVNRDGSGSQVLLRTSGDPQLLRLSPDGSRISYTVGDPETEALSLWEMNADGSDPKLRVGAASRDANACCGSWSADGRYFIYSLSRDGVSNLWARADEDGARPWESTKSVQLTTNATSTFASVAIDSRRMFAFVAGTRFESVHYAPSTGHYVPFLPDTEVLWPQFSPDSRYVAFQRVTDRTIWRTDADGSNPIQLAGAPWRAARPRWSPDGTRIAFEAVSPANPQRAYVVSAGGGPAEEIVPGQPGSHSLPSWSPDGRSIALAVNVRRADVPTAERGIFIVDWETRGATKLARSEGLTAPGWSPDGRYLIAQTLDQAQVLRFDAAANGWVEIARGKSLSGPTWSADSRFLYVQDIRESGSPVYRLRVPNFDRDGTFSLAPLLARGFQVAAFQGLAPDGSLIVQLSRTGTQVHAIDLALR